MIAVESFSKARVVSNKDELMIGRVQIRLNIVHGDSVNGVSDEDLPWAICGDNRGGTDRGQYLVPSVGDTVFVLFEDNNLNYPIYFGARTSYLEALTDIYEEPVQDVVNKDPLGNTVLSTYAKYKSAVEIIESSGAGLFMFSSNIEKRGNKKVSNSTQVSIKDSIIMLWNNVRQGLKIVSNGSNYIELVSTKDRAKGSFIRLNDSDSITINVNNSSEVILKDKEVTLNVGSSSIQLTESGIKISTTGTLDLIANSINMSANTAKIGGKVTGVTGAVNLGDSPLANTHSQVAVSEFVDGKEEDGMYE